MTYTLRVSIKTLGQTPISGIDEPVEIKIGEKQAIFQMRAGHLIVRVAGFSTETEAEAFLPRVKAGLWNISLVKHVAFVPEFGRSEITIAQDPVKAGKNFAKNYGLDGSPVHGLGNEGGYAVFRTNQNMRFMGGGQMTGSISTPIDQVAPIFVEAVSASNHTAIADSNFSTAMSLYLGQFFESSIRARLLTLMMVLEVLAPAMPKHESAVQLLEQATRGIDERLSGCADEEERFALESLKRELDFRKETSIRRRVRQLVMSGTGLQDADRKQLARDVVRAYDLRGQLIHTGTADEGEMHAALDTVFQTTKALLRGKLGLPG